MVIKNKKLLYIFFSSLAITILFYWRIFNTFYQQDEWQAFGHFIASGWHVLGENLSLIDLILAKGRLLTVALYAALFTIQPYNVTLIAIIALLMHALNGFLLYRLLVKIIKNEFASIVGMIFFLTNAVANQAVIWSGASLAIIISTTFVLLSLSYFWNYLFSSQLKDFILSILFIFISLHFKESALAVLPLYVVMYIVLHKKKLHKSFFLIALIPTLYFILFATFRVGGSLTSSQRVGDYINSTHNVKEVIFANAVTYTFTSFSQLLFPAPIIYNLADNFVRIEYAYLENNAQFQLIAQSLGTDFINFAISFLFLSLLIVVVILKREYRPALFFIGVLLACLMPYILIQRGNSYLESRYYYLLLIPMSGLMGIILHSVSKYKNKFALIIASSLLFIIILHYYFVTTQELKNQQYQARVRLSILHSLKEQIPSLKSKAVIYVASDTSYILPSNPLPFQEGVGYTFLMYLYTNKDEELKALLLENFLWDVGTQGYKEINGRGYGFFSDFSELKKAMQEYNLTKSDVIGLQYDSHTNKLIDITKSIQKKLD